MESNCSYNIRLSGVHTALIMPFKDNKIDYHQLEKLVEFQYQNSIDGIVVHGTTGEAPTMTDSEFVESCNFILQNWQKKLHITIGVSKNSTADVLRKIDLLQHAPDALLITPPAYSKPTQEGILRHFEAICKHTKIPVILYNVPGRTVSDIMPQTFANLVSGFDNIVAIKDATGSLARMSEEQYVLRNIKRPFAMITGDDQITPHFMLSGGDGVISVISNCLPRETKQMVTLLLACEKEKAYAIYFKMFNLIRLLFVESNPIPIKYIMYKMGFCDLEYRLPMCQPSTSLMADIDVELKVLNLIQ